ncbi:uncharacterized protein LOC135937586 [Cloeon dipterum]|uniref:uncharacterized protein LOC135937586 n=1 Tax=Cloeon dipterum TaxID=197152 RepID=UPI00321FCE16
MEKDDKEARFVELTKVFHWIAFLAPNVEELSLSRPRAGVRILDMQLLLPSLSQMKKLRKPAAQLASVGALWHVEHDLRDGSEHKRNLQNLRVLEVNNLWRSQHHDFFATVAPHLDYTLAQNWEYLPLSSDEKEMPPFLKRRFITLGEREMLHEGLELDCLSSIQTSPISLRTLTSKSNASKRCCISKKVEALIFHGVSCLDIVERILAAFGHQLHSLAILSTHPSVNLALGKISLLCPKLERLHLVNASVLDTTKEVFPELTELIWINSKEIRSASSLLCAPKLRKLMMKGVFSLSDLEKCTEMIEKGDVLKELRAFSVILDHRNNPMFYEQQFNAANRMMKTASTLLPKLVNFQFGQEIDSSHESDEEVDVAFLHFRLDTCYKLVKEYNKHNGVCP